MSPVPCVLKELFASQVVLLDALLGKSFHHLCLGCDRRMVGSWRPAGVLSLHAGTPYQDVLYGVVQHVTHVEHTCDVWWRNDYRVWLASIGF